MLLDECIWDAIENNKHSRRGVEDQSLKAGNKSSIRRHTRTPAAPEPLTGYNYSQDILGHLVEVSIWEYLLIFGLEHSYCFGI